MTRASSDRSVSLAPLVDALCRNRRTLLILYALVMVALLLAVTNVGLLNPEWLHALWGDADEGLNADEDVVLSLAVFALAHVAFLWGGGRVSLGSEPAGAWRVVLPVIVAVAMLVALVLMLAAALLEMFDRFQGEGALRDEAASLNLEPLVDAGGLWWLLGVWVVWSVIGVYLLRSRDQFTGLARLITAVLATSWVEFFVALPVDIAIRQRADDCPCATGSWLALFVCVPILLFTFGPGLLLLYLREWRLAKTEPRRAMKILVRKSRRAPKP